MNRRLQHSYRFVWMATCGLLLTGCDAMLHLSYVVHNTSKHPIVLYIPSFPIDSLPRAYGNTRDTTLELPSNESLTVGLKTDIGFPWAHKQLYRKHPGKCGIRQISSDTNITLDCTQHTWKYKRGVAQLDLK